VKTFTLALRDASHSEEVEGVESFVGEDASGSFGILANHDRMMTALLFGLSRYRVGGDHWHYLAMPGGILYAVDNVVTISTRRYFRDDSFERISATLHQELLKEEQSLRAVRRSLRRMEEEMLKRMRELGKEGMRIG
jgi:F-type H+-transporting ATPase subunit epsilon